jgi:hypothetical protein
VLASSPILSYQVVLDPAETVRASQAIERRARRRGPVLALYGLCLAPIAIAVATQTMDRVLPPYLLVLAVILVGAVAWPPIQRYRLRRLYAETPSLRGFQMYELSTDHFECSNALSHAVMQWDAFTEVAETDEFFLFYFAKKRAYYLPKAVIGGTSEEERLRQFLTDRLGARAHVENGDPSGAT